MPPKGMRLKCRGDAGVFDGMSRARLWDDARRWRSADIMLRPRKTIDAAGTRARLGELQAAIHREAEGAEADPFDDAMVAAVAGLAEALKAEADALAEVESQMGRLARRT